MPVVEDDFGYAKFRFFNCGLKIMLNVCELDECTIWKVLIFINCFPGRNSSIAKWPEF